MIKKVRLCVLGIACLMLQLCITENRAATLSELLYSAMFKDDPFTVQPVDLDNITGQPLAADPFIAAGRADPDAGAVCRVTTQIKDEKFKLATGALVNINGRRVVLTTATLENPVQVEFFGSGNSVIRHKVVKTTSKGTIKNGNLTASNLQVLFLEGEPTATPLELATAEKVWQPFIPELYEFIARKMYGVPLKVFGCGFYYTQLQDDSGRLKGGFYLPQSPIKVNVEPHPLSLVDSNRSKDEMPMVSKYFPDGFKTHIFDGFSGAPVINRKGNVESIITFSTPILEEKPVVSQVRLGSSLAIAATLGTGFLKYGVPKNRLDKFVVGLAVGGWLNKAVTRDSSEAYSLLGYQNLRSRDVQEWLNRAVPKE